jgi:hypothetical protein
VTAPTRARKTAAVKPPPRDVVFAELRRLRYDRAGQGTRTRYETFCHVYTAETYGTPRLLAEIVLQHLGDGDLRCVGPDGDLVQAKPLVATRFRFTGEVAERPITFSERSGSVRVAIYEEVPR